MSDLTNEERIKRNETEHIKEGALFVDTDDRLLKVMEIDLNRMYHNVELVVVGQVLETATVIKSSADLIFDRPYLTANQAILTLLSLVDGEDPETLDEFAADLMPVIDVLRAARNQGL